MFSEEESNSIPWSSVAHYFIGAEHRIFPLTELMEARLLLSFLVPLGDYHDVRIPYHTIPSHSALLLLLHSYDLHCTRLAWVSSHLISFSNALVRDKSGFHVLEIIWSG